MDGMPKPTPVLSEKLRCLVERDSRSQAEIAEKAGIPQSTLARFIGKEPSTPRADTALALANVFDVDVAWLIDDQQEWIDPPPSPGRTLDAGELMDEVARRYRASLVDVLEALEHVEQSDIWPTIKEVFGRPLTPDTPYAPTLLQRADGALDTLQLAVEMWCTPENRAYMKHDRMPGSDRDRDELLLSALVNRARKLENERPELEWVRIYHNLRASYWTHPDRRDFYERLRSNYIEQIERGETPDPLDNPLVLDMQAIDPGSTRAQYFREAALNRRRTKGKSDSSE